MVFGEYNDYAMQEILLFSRSREKVLRPTWEEARFRLVRFVTRKTSHSVKIPSL